jgi:hypothetical protein
MNRRIACFRSLVVFLVVLASFVGGSASRVSAQATFLDDQGGMDVRMFRPAVDSKGFISLNGTSVLGDRDYSFGLVLDMGVGIFPIGTFAYNP